MNIEKAIKIIKNGGIVAFPTETVYGLAADAWNPSAISKIYETKGRPIDNPLIVHIHSKECIHDFCIDIPEKVYPLIEKYWPGPLTLILKKRPEVLNSVTAGLDTVAIRIPNHKLALELISKTGPLVAPSANQSGKPSPTKAEHVISDFSNKLLVLDGKATKIGLESTVLDLTNKEPLILRPGKISKIEIEEILCISIKESFSHHIHSPRSPGQKYSHYQPKADVRWLCKNEIPNKATSMYLLQSMYVPKPNIICYNANLSQLAKELYDRFRQADIENYKEIVIESLDMNHSLHSALNNRITKAMGS